LTDYSTSGGGGDFPTFAADILPLAWGKEVNERWLSQQLSPYGIRSRTIWIGEDSAKGYLDDDFTEAFRRYVSKGAVEALIEGWKRPEAAQKAEESEPELALEGADVDHQGPANKDEVA
jgi:hypothetical protein